MGRFPRIASGAQAVCVCIAIENVVSSPVCPAHLTKPEDR